MFYACRDRDLAEIERLDKDFANGLAGACYGGHVDLALRMIRKGATNFNDCLHFACMAGKLKTAQIMIDHGADDFNGGLVHAGNIQVAQLMVDHGAIDFHNHYLLRRKLYHIVDFLISKGERYPYNEGYEEYNAWLRCVLALPILCEDVLRMVT